MKIVVIGGTGLIGSKLVSLLEQAGHQVVPASPNSGVNTLTGQGLDEALAGADTVVDVSNSPSFEDAAVLDFFRTSTGNVLAAEGRAGVGHHVVLSVVGTDRLPDSGYMRAKVAQEQLIKAGKVPYSILHATQFFEFLGGIAASGAVDGKTHLTPALMQPLAADDVAAALADIAVGAPLNGTAEIAGPEVAPLADFVRRFLQAKGDQTEVVVDEHARYFGTELDDESLTPRPGARLGTTTFADWLARQAGAE
jgi:uncharacterized protein YbjT (DUF2867 family)